jgi:hypothetical protein
MRLYFTIIASIARSTETAHTVFANERFVTRPQTAAVGGIRPQIPRCKTFRSIGGMARVHAYRFPAKISLL